MSDATNDNTNDDVLINSNQVAHILCVSRRTLWRLVRSGKIPQPTRYNRKLVRWKKSHIDEYVKTLPQGDYVVVNQPRLPKPTKIPEPTEPLEQESVDDYDEY